jgi:hypothetical protein
MELRSNGNIMFPRGFITPKVGPHQSYGFEAGSIFGEKAHLKMVPNAVSVSNPSIEYIVSSSEAGDKIWVTLLNQENLMQDGKLKIDFDAFKTGKLESKRVVNNKGSEIKKMETNNDWEISVPALGLVVIEFGFEN